MQQMIPPGAHSDKDYRHQNDKRYLIPDCGFLHRYRSNERGKPKDQQNVHNVTSHNIANGDPGAPLQGCRHADCRLGKGRSHRHNGKAYHKLGNPKFFRQPACAFHKPVRPLHQKDKPKRQQSDLNQYIHNLSSFS